MRPDLVVADLGKRFYRYDKNRPMTFQEAVLRGLRGLGATKQFWALRHVSFELVSGQTLGIIGPNGAGKSTLLRLIGGVEKADEGSIEVNRHVGALLDLGLGFHPDLTGRENVFINGVISGLLRREVEQRFSAIVEFAEMGDFIDSPLRTYSTGMRMRLAFAVAVHLEAEILLIDEVLSVGDTKFGRKCLDRIEKLKGQGLTIVLVSHDAKLIGQFCDQVLWLRAGQTAAFGDADSMTRQYSSGMLGDAERLRRGWEPAHTSTAKLRLGENRFGSLSVEFTSVKLLDRHDSPVTEMDSGEPLRIELDYVARQPTRSPIFGITVSRDDGLVCYDTSTEADGLIVPTVRGEGKVAFQLDELNLVEGNYFIDVGVYEQDWAQTCDYHWHVYPVRVRAPKGEGGVVRLHHEWLLDG